MYSIYNQKRTSYVFYKSCSKRFCNFYKRTTKCQSLFLIKKRLTAQTVSVRFVKYLRTTFFQNTSEKLLLQYISECPHFKKMIRESGRARCGREDDYIVLYILNLHCKKNLLIFRKLDKKLQN